MTSFDLHGHTALVTGGFSGLGLHFAEVLANHGAKVALVGRRIELGRNVAHTLGAKIGRPADVRAYQADVTRSASVTDAIGLTTGHFGVPTIVINNAGIVKRTASLEVKDDDWDDVVDVNLSGVFKVAQAAARAMVKANSPGTIINIASILGLRVRTSVASYAATKAGVIQLTKALALEWAVHGIRVNALAPGYFETEINREFLRSAPGQAIVSRVPQQRVGLLTELDGPLLLLASDASSYMTGSVIAVDGGHLVSTL